MLTDADALVNDGSSWSNVTLPHAWNATDAAQTAQTSPTSKDYKRGKGWYRLEFNGTATGATQWLQFDGASIVADVWLNGQKLGQHKGAFTAFRFDVTSKLKSGKNVLLIKTDNSAAATDTSLTAIAPLSGDFNMAPSLRQLIPGIRIRHWTACEATEKNPATMLELGLSLVELHPPVTRCSWLVAALSLASFQ